MSNNACTLSIDCYQEIGLYLQDKKKLMFASTCKSLYKLKNVFVYKTLVEFSRVSKLSYFDQFENISAIKDVAFPKKAKRIYFTNIVRPYVPNLVTHLLQYIWLNNISSIIIPSSVTHLIFAENIEQRTEICILFSVTHLIFEGKICRHIDIPSSVTHLRFDYKFHQYIKIPPSATHLAFGGKFKQNIEKIVIPSSVTHLMINERIFEQIDNIPTSVTTLSFCSQFSVRIYRLPKFIKRIYLYRKYYEIINDDIKSDVEIFLYDDDKPQISIDLYFSDQRFFRS
uniref:F-box domain-containing protein n=1 Tax=viral metagenome TaxID=1070528 RepID=A0A6C0CAJ3_9ZZZZ